MKVLLTGAFGNIGTSTLEALVKRNHQIRCFDLKTLANEQVAKRFAGQIEVVWGDLRQPAEVAAAVQGQDVVLHVAYVIPKLSVTGVNSEERPDWARAINVDGTRNLLNALRAQPTPPKLIFTSSLHVFGRTQDQAPPRTAADPVQPVEHYAHHKVECEQLIKESGLTWMILRLAAALPVRLILDLGMFDVPLDNRIEYVHTRDVGVALANAVDCAGGWGKILLIGGGPKCQLHYRELLTQVLTAVGVGPLPAEAFTTVQYSVDWLDTTESQKLLNYQQRTLADYIQDTQQIMGFRQPLVKLLRPLVRRWLLSHSPYYRAARR